MRGGGGGTGGGQGGLDGFDGGLDLRAEAGLDGGFGTGRVGDVDGFGLGYGINKDLFPAGGEITVMSVDQGVDIEEGLAKLSGVAHGHII